MCLTGFLLAAGYEKSLYVLSEKGEGGFVLEGLSVFSVCEGLCALLTAHSATAAFCRGFGPVVLVQFNGFRKFIVQLHFCFLDKERHKQICYSGHIEIPVAHFHSSLVGREWG